MEYVVETEKEIVQNYIIKSKQERIEWELSHSKKRKDIIWHFHKPDIFKEACLHAVDYMDKEAMKNYLHKLSGAENVYFIGEDYIGKMLLEQAAERANEGEICNIVETESDIIKENRKKELRQGLCFWKKNVAKYPLKFKKNVTNSIE